MQYDTEIKGKRRPSTSHQERLSQISSANVALQQASFPIRLVPEAEVVHLCRTGWDEIVTKARRTKGGQVAAGPLPRRAAWILRTLCLPVRDTLAYARSLEPEQLHGVASNVKSIFHEMLVPRAENLDGDTVTACLFEATNHTGADIEFSIEGDVIREVQLKAVEHPSTILEHFARYPSIEPLRFPFYGG